MKYFGEGIKRLPKNLKYLKIDLWDNNLEEN